MKLKICRIIGHRDRVVVVQETKKEREGSNYYQIERRVLRVEECRFCERESGSLIHEIRWELDE